MGKFILVFLTNSAQFCFLFHASFPWSSVSAVSEDPKHPRAFKKLRFALLLPAYNEERVIKFSVESLFKIKYPCELLIFSWLPTIAPTVRPP